MKRIFYLPAGEARTIEELDKQHGIDEEVPGLIPIVLMAAATVFLITVAVIAGFTYWIWGPIVFK